MKQFIYTLIGVLTLSIGLIADPPRPGECDNPKPWGCDDPTPLPTPNPPQVPDCALTPPYCQF